MATRQEAGRKGAEARHAKSSRDDSPAKKAAATRKREDSSAFKKMGAKGGKARSGRNS